MTTSLIKQIVQGDGPMQTVKMIVRDNERGPRGETGATGEAATITAGAAYSTPAGTNPAVMNVGTSSNAVFDFYIPKGEQGTPGKAATVAVGSTTTLPAGHNAIVTNSGDATNAVLNFSIPTGARGERGLRGPQGVPGQTGAPGAPGAPGKDGVVQYTAGNGITISAENEISATYELPIASDSTLGGIKVGSGLAVNSSGTLSADLGSGLTLDSGNHINTKYFTTNEWNALWA